MRMRPANVINERKEWKPPYCLRLLALTLLLLAVVGVDADPPATPGLDDGSDINVTVTSGPFSLKFEVDNPDEYTIQEVTCKSTISSEESSCDSDLNPCSQYQATIIITEIAADRNVTKIMVAQTDYVEPTVRIESVDAKVTEITVRWEATHKTCIESYEVEVTAPGKDYKWSFTNDTQQLTINALNPCEQYNITLKSNDVKAQLISDETTTVSTLYAEPGNVAIAVAPFNTVQMKASWDLPENWSCINYYYLKWYSIDCDISQRRSQRDADASGEGSSDETQLLDTCYRTANLTDPLAKEYVLSDLNGCDDYFLEMYINNVVTLKSEKVDFVSPNQVPGKVSLQNPDLEATNFTLRWNTPEEHGKCVIEYEVTVEGPINREGVVLPPNVGLTKNTFFFLDGLDPCGRYNVSIMPISVNGSGPIVTAQYDLLIAQASPVRNVQTEPLANSVNIIWDPPEIGDLCVTQYRLALWSNDTTPTSEIHTNTTTTSKNITSLISCITYTVQIIANNNNDMDGEPIQVVFETEAAPPTVPSTLDTLGDYSDALEFSARVIENSNNCKTIFARFVCEISNKSLDVPYKVAEKYVEGKVGDMSFSAVVSPLWPNTEYVCAVSLFNVAGWSQNKSRISKTQPYFPERPRNLSLSSSTNHSLQIVWKEPKYANGVIKNYNLYLQQIEAAYYIPPSCSKPKADTKEKTTSSLTASFDDLQAYTWYSIQVSAQNEFGDGAYTRPFTVKTNASVSTAVQQLTVATAGPFDSYEEYNASVTVTWLAPCRSGGDIDHFELVFNGSRDDTTTPEFFTETVAPDFDTDGYVSYKETRLKPEYTYDVSVGVYIKTVAERSPLANISFEAPAGIPSVLSESILNQTRIETFDATDSNNPAKSAVVYLPTEILQSESGTIRYIALLVSQKGCNNPPKMRHGALGENAWPDVPTWTSAYNNTDCIPQYQTTPRQWNPDSSRSLVRDGLEEKYKYIIGVDNCDSVASSVFCNGPLKPDTEYYLVVRLFTKSGYNDAALLDFKTDSLIEFMLILIIVCSCLLVALIVGLVYLWITNRIQWKRQSSIGIEDSCGDVMAKNFAIYYREISKPEKVSREFKELTTVAIDLSCSASELGCHKNRYADIFPYDKNRVILDIDADGSDYINASFIDGYRKKKEYIATQGPKPESVVDFWRMILQHNVRVIVMVTQFRESDVVKCHEYYPYKSRNINAMIKRVDCFELYDRTELVVTHDKYGVRQKVVHFHFKKWPDHGCPSDPTQLITFVRKVKAEKLPNHSPIVIHCSAGVGRTGTFIALDIIMQRLKNEGKINIYETVKKLRFQRMKMVQSQPQYTFLYNCIYELVKHKNPKPGAEGAKKKTSGKKVSFEDDEEVAKEEVGTSPKSFAVTEDDEEVAKEEVGTSPKSFAVTDIMGLKEVSNGTEILVPTWNNKSDESPM